MRERVLEPIKAAKENRDNILSGVIEWVDKAESHITEANKIFDRAKAESHVSEAEEVTGGANDESRIAEEIQVIDGVKADSHISEAKEDIDWVEGIANKILSGVREWVGCQKAESHVSEAKTIIEGAKAEEATGGANADSHISEDIEVVDGVNADSQENIDGVEGIDGGTYYSYGKKAANMARLLKTVQEDGKPFEYRVSVSTRPHLVGLSGSFEYFTISAAFS